MNPEIICEKTRTARKIHKCDYCGGNIEAGEKYNDAALKYDGTVYNWRSHKKCDYIASEIWEYVDPCDGGMCADDFAEGCQDFCRAFVCPDCPCYEENECMEDEPYCLEKIYAILQNHRLVRCKDRWGGYSQFQLEERTREVKDEN